MNKIQYYRMGSVNLVSVPVEETGQDNSCLLSLFVNSINLRETTPEFDSLMNANPYIRKSFEEQFIVGMKYDFIYDNNITKQRTAFIFRQASAPQVTCWICITV